MKRGKKGLIIKIYVAVTSVILGIAASYAWFMHKTSVEAFGYMGAVKVGINEEVEVTADGVAFFEISNDSTIDTYIRLGWTPVYKKANEKTYLTTDISGIEVTAAHLTGDSENDPGLYGMKLLARKVTSFNEYEKNMIIMEDEQQNYFVVPAGTKITGQIVLNTYNILGSDSSLYIIFIPEALQATKKAAAEAEPYGWIASKAEKQARTIYVEGGAE